MYNGKVENYSSSHMAEIFEALNKKLIALGFDPASEAEFYEGNGGLLK